MTETKLFPSDIEVANIGARDTLLEHKAFYILPFYTASLQDWKKAWVEETIRKPLATSPDDRPFATDLKGVFNEMLIVGAPSQPRKSDIILEFGFSYGAYGAM